MKILIVIISIIVILILCEIFADNRNIESDRFDDDL